MNNATKEIYIDGKVTSKHSDVPQCLIYLQRFVQAHPHPKIVVILLLEVVVILIFALMI